MLADRLLYNHLQEYCYEIHASRLQSVIDVACGLQQWEGIFLVKLKLRIKLKK